MYNSYTLAKKYVRYYFTASNGKGHGVHSPFVFQFIKNVINDNKEYSCYSEIEDIRKGLLRDEMIIDVEDFGAGSALAPHKKKSVRTIAKASLKSKKYSQLLFRITQYFKPHTIIELGTSLGITTCYLSKGNPAATIYTLEGSSNIAALANEIFNESGVKNIQLTEGNFDKTLPHVLNNFSAADMAFVDGNHRKVPTINYFRQLIKKTTENSFLIFDDIHWSREMEAAWEEIKNDPAVTLSIDLFFIGIVFFKKEFRVKQHFTIRF
ncbi:class I SAM-dependent methyltransferase [soil metagenome]